jgi:hypothetical protein
MAHITRLAFARHLRAEPNQYILHYRAGSLARKGVGLTTVAYMIYLRIVILVLDV